MRQFTFFTMFLFSIMLLNACQSHKKGDNELILNVENRTYDSLKLVVMLNDLNTNIKIKGESDDQKTWRFIFPDSVYERQFWARIAVPRKDEKFQDLAYSVKDVPGNLNDFSLKKGKLVLNVCYQSTDTATSPFQTFILDHFSLLEPISNEFVLSSRAIQSGFSYFGGAYNEDMQKYENIVKTTPDSPYLIAQLASTLRLYHSKEDVRKLFLLFTERAQKSESGERVKKYLTEDHFENSSLPNSQTKIIEPIIQHADKYNLILFSASWCGPCHKQIPLLKEIYTDLSDKVEFTYISIDEPEQVGSWIELMQKEDIPWRSLLANGQAAMKEKYNADLIPTGMLVYPDGKMENIDVRKAEDKAKLYKLASE